MQKKIRLLTISATCEIGGSDINLLRLLRQLDKEEYYILHLIPYAGPLIDKFKNSGINVKIVDMPRIRIFKNPLRYIIVLLKFFPTVFKIKKIIEDYQINIVCTSSMVNLYGALAARLAHRPHILMVGEYLPVLKLVSPYFYLLSEKIICCSKMVTGLFSNINKVLVLYPSLDLDEFNPNINANTLREELGINAKLVSMITRLAPWKGIEVFIKAASYIKVDAKFVIFGEPVIEREKYILKLEKMIDQLGLKEKFLVKLGEYKNIPQIIAALDIVVHASLRPEPFGLIIIEAMAMQKPVIASGLGGPLEIINDGVDGLLVEQGNPEMLASSISKLLQDAKTAERMGIKAREKIREKFNIDRYATNFDKIFKTTLREYSIKHTRLLVRRTTLLNISALLARLLVPSKPKRYEISKEIKKILIIQFFSMGDLICSIPLLQVFKRHFNKSSISLLTYAKLGGLTDIIAYKDDVIGYKRGIISKFGLISIIRRNKYDMAVILNPLFQGAWIAYLSQAKYRIGYVRDYENIQNIKRLSHFLTHLLLPQDKPMHDIQRYLAIAEFLGIDTTYSLSILNIPKDAIEWADTFLQDNGIEDRDFIFAINPHAGWESKCWDMEKFARVADTITEKHNAKVIFLGSSAASDICRIDKIVSSMKHKAISAAGKTDIPKLAALINRCNIFLTHDTGPIHLAAALGKDIVVLFGPSDINKFGYKRENIINITAQGPFCKPCVLNYQYKNNCEDNVCMKEIAIEEVIQAVDKLIKNKKYG